MTNPTRILVVDDEPPIVELISGYLAREGWEVSAVSDGLSAVEAVRERAPDVVVLDVMLPGTVAAGLGGLVLYNLAYITPLVVLLVLASRPGLIRVINRWHLEHAVGTKVLLAIVVLALGFAILRTV
jgi:DNA-binding response OmpR family regulator